MHLNFHYSTYLTPKTLKFNGYPEWSKNGSNDDFSNFRKRLWFVSTFIHTIKNLAKFEEKPCLSHVFYKNSFSQNCTLPKTQKSTTRSVTNWDFGNVLGHEDSRKERESCVWNVLCFLHNTARWQKFFKISHFTQEEEE